MCNARVVFCRHTDCFGVIGWYVPQPCLQAFLAGCVEGYYVFENSQGDWAASRSGCRVPQVESRQRTEHLACVDCLRKAMDNTMASAKGGGGKGLLGRRVQKVMNQGRASFGEGGWRDQEEPAAAHGSTSSSSGRRDTADDGLDTQSYFADDTVGAETQHDAPGATHAHGLRGPVEPSLETTTTTAQAKARASDNPASPSYYLDAEDVPLNAITTFRPTHVEHPAVSASYSPPVGFQEPAMGELSLPFGTDHVTAQVNFHFDGDVLDQSNEFWDMLVDPSDGGLAYVFGQSGHVPGAKRRRSEDAGDLADESAQGGKRQCLGRDFNLTFKEQP